MTGIPNLCPDCDTELGSEESGDERGMLYWCKNQDCESLGYVHEEGMMRRLYK